MRNDQSFIDNVDLIITVKITILLFNNVQSICVFALALEKYKENN